MVFNILDWWQNDKRTEAELEEVKKQLSEVANEIETLKQPDIDEGQSRASSKLAKAKQLSSTLFHDLDIQKFLFKTGQIKILEDIIAVIKM